MSNVDNQFGNRLTHARFANHKSKINMLSKSRIYQEIVDDITDAIKKGSFKAIVPIPTPPFGEYDAILEHLEENGYQVTHHEYSNNHTLEISWGDVGE